MVILKNPALFSPAHHAFHGALSLFLEVPLEPIDAAIVAERIGSPFAKISVGFSISGKSNSWVISHKDNKSVEGIAVPLLFVFKP